MLRGDLGNSLWQGTPVAEHLLARLPVTFELGLIALVVGLVIALPIGIYSAMRQDTAGDYLARSFSILLLAVPSFWLGTMVVVFPSIWWGWSPPVELRAASRVARRQPVSRCCCPASCWARRCRPSPCA